MLKLAREAATNNINWRRASNICQLLISKRHLYQFISQVKPNTVCIGIYSTFFSNSQLLNCICVSCVLIRYTVALYLYRRLLGSLLYLKRVLQTLANTNRERRAWYLLRGWSCRSSPGRNIAPRRRLSPSARKSSGWRSPGTEWNGSRHLAKDKPCCPCTCNSPPPLRYYLWRKIRTRHLANTV